MSNPKNIIEYIEEYLEKQIMINKFKNMIREKSYNKIFFSKAEELLTSFNDLKVVLKITENETDVLKKVDEVKNKIQILYNIYVDFSSKGFLQKYDFEEKNEIVDVINVVEGILLKPKESAQEELSNIDKITKKLGSSKLSVAQRVDLQSEMGRSALNYVIYSTLDIFKHMDKKMSHEDYITQQEFLNISMANKVNDKKEVSFWYGVHWYLRNDKENADFYFRQIKNLFTETLGQEDKRTIVLKLLSSDNWLNNKFPTDIQKIYSPQFNKQPEVVLENSEDIVNDKINSLRKKM